MLLPSLWSLTHYTWIPIRCSERHDAKGFWTQTRQLKFELRRQNPRWPAMKLNSFHCSFHAFSLGSTKTSASQFQDNVRGNWWCNNPTLMHQWCYLWLVSWFQLLSFGSNKKSAKSLHLVDLCCSLVSASLVIPIFWHRLSIGQTPARVELVLVYIT